MTISGKEEARVRRTPWLSTDCSAAIPLKKRKFLFNRSPSPPTEEPFPNPVENDSQCHENGSISQFSAISGTVSIATSASCPFDTNKNAASLVKRSSETATGISGESCDDHPKAKTQESGLLIQSVTHEDREKLLKTKGSVSAAETSMKTELKLAPIEAISQNGDAAGLDKQKLEGLCLPAEPAIVRTADLSLSAAFEDQSSGKGCQNQGNGTPLSLNLSLSKRDCSAQHKTNDSACCSGGVSESVNRSSWDLNTTMDTWEAASSDGGAGLVSSASLNINNGSNDIMPSIHLDGVIGENVRRKEKIRQNSDTGTPPTQLNLQHTPECSLSLGLSPFSLLERYSSSSDGAHGGRVGSAVSCSRTVSCNLDMVNLGIVKPEPLDEVVKCNASGTKNPMGMMDNSIKPEAAERCIKESGMSNSSFIKSADATQIKHEPIMMDIPDSLEKKDKISNQSSKQNPLGNDSQATATLMPIHMVKQVQHAKDIGRVPTPMIGVALSLRVPNSAECSVPADGTQNSGAAHQGACQSIEKVGLEMTASPMAWVGVSPGVSDSAECSVHVNATQNSSAVHQEAGQGIKQAGTEKISSPIAGVASSPAVPNAAECSVRINGTQSSSATHQEACQSMKQVGVEMISSSIGENSSICNVSFDLPPDTRERNPGYLSDQEKISLPDDMPEKDLDGSDYESQGVGHLSVALDKEKDGRVDAYEDGEVCRSVVLTAAEGLSTKRSRSEYDPDVDFDNGTTDITCLKGHEFSPSSHFVDKDNDAEVPDETSDLDTKDAYSQESVEKPTGEFGEQIHEVQTNTHGISGQKDAPDVQGEEHLFDRVTYTSEGSLVTASLGFSGDVKNPDTVENNTLTSTKADVSSSIDDLPKDANAGASQSRIINLSQVSNKALSGVTPAMSGETLPLRTGKDKLPDVALETGKFHPRGRNEDSFDYSYKFSRERHHDRLSRNPSFRFMGNRRRVSSQIGNAPSNRDSGRGFNPRFSGGQRDFAVRRNKYESAFAEADIEFNDYDNSCRDNGYASRGRRGRRLSNNETPFFSHLPSRRSSPEWSHTPADGGLPFMHKGLRNFGPGRFAGEGVPGFREFRHREKFGRALPHESSDPVFRRRQPSYEELSGDFLRGNNNFYSIQGRDRHKIRSRSPIRLRGHSPDACSSFRNRSLDGLDEHTGLHHRRSPQGFRMEMIRSPDQSCFSRDMVMRRHDSPTYFSRPPNISRDMDPGRRHTYSRSAAAIQKPSDRVPLRNRGKFDTADTGERGDCDVFFGRPMPSGRFEFDFDGNFEERRRFRDRCNPARSIQHHFDGRECEPLNAKGDPETSRFCEEENTEIHEQGKLRAFDRQIKDGVVHRTTGDIDEKEASPTPEGQVWPENGFDDISQAKRQRN